ncbi:MAG: 4Fe-4S dicluster domain-containing protein [Defluviitaleaceae bacterium]|nr:4Fe-4S dicluster domain-containing protein [Defluviitaleaceae bacterium]
MLTEVNECDITNLAERRTAAVGDIKMPLVPHVAEALKSIGEEEMLALFNSDEWDELQRACLTCGTCTFICPTCHCYDIGDRRLGNGEVERCRTWDSCIYRDFTQMAHGNPRLAALPRFRQRYMHKLVYFMQNNGMYACTGCGRCVAKCPVYINIVKVMLAFINARKRTEEATHV